MISQKKLESNRRNAAKSTGPKTEEGKAIAKMNGVTHGLTCRQCPILPGEDEEAFREFRAQLIADLKPRGIMQREIVDDIVQIRWKLRRIANIEATMMQRQQEQMIERHEERNWQKGAIQEPAPQTHPVQVLAAEFFSHGADNPYERMELYRQRLTRAMHTSLRELRKLREETGEETGEEEIEFEKPNPPASEPSPPNNFPGHSLPPETRSKMHPLPNPLPAYSEREPGFNNPAPCLDMRALFRRGHIAAAHHPHAVGQESNKMIARTTFALCVGGGAFA